MQKYVMHIYKSPSVFSCIGFWPHRCTGIVLGDQDYDYYRTCLTELTGVEIYNCIQQSCMHEIHLCNKYAMHLFSVTYCAEPI